MGIENLSRREHQIAAVYASGESHRQIAERLCISPATVRTHLRTIYRKLAVSSKIGLLRALEGKASGARYADPEDAAAEVRERRRTLSEAGSGPSG